MRPSLFLTSLAISSSCFVLPAKAYDFETGPNADELTSKGQCYSYFDHETITSSDSLGLCKVFCAGIDNELISCISPGKETQVDPSSIFVDAVGRLWTPGVCSCNGPPELVGVSRAATPRAKKTVIPDLTAIGYALEKDEPNNQVKDDFETWDIKYSGKMDVLVDNIGWPNVENQETGAVWLPLLYNKGSPDDPTHPGDLNPNKVPLRDIILSFWQQKTGRSVRELYKFWYGAVSEQGAVNAVAGAYKAMKLTFDRGTVVHREGPRSGEVEAFSLLMDTVFAIGLTKLTQEYEEFDGRQIDVFKIICEVDEDGTEDCDVWDLQIWFMSATIEVV